MYAPFPMN